MQDERGNSNQLSYYIAQQNHKIYSLTNTSGNKQAKEADN